MGAVRYIHTFMVMKRINIIKDALAEGAFTAEMTVCRAALCCSIRQIDFKIKKEELKPIINQLEDFIGFIPSYLLDDVDMIWWDGHFDGTLAISDENEFFWSCNNGISSDYDEEKCESILKNLIEQRKKDKSTWIFESDEGEIYQLADDYNDDDSERDDPLEGYSMSHISKEPVEFESEPMEDKLKLWLLEHENNNLT